MKVKLNKQGQITIPWLFRASYMLRPGDAVEVDSGKEPGTLVLRPKGTMRPWIPDDGEGWDWRRKRDWQPLPSPAEDVALKNTVQEPDKTGH